MPVINRLGILMAEKGLRERRRITVEQLSQETGINRQTLINWRKNSVTRFDAMVVETLCRYFGCDLSELLMIDPPVEKQPEREPA
jgi:putative transcriptional regulator